MDKLPRGVQRRVRIGTVSASLQMAAIAIKQRAYDAKEPMLVFVAPDGAIYACGAGTRSAAIMETQRKDWLFGMFTSTCPTTVLVKNLMLERERLRGQRRRAKAASRPPRTTAPRLPGVLS